MIGKRGQILPGVVAFKWQVHGDRRGHFREIFRTDRLAEAGIVADFVQDNVSYSRRGVLRGLHFQNPNPQGKLLVPLTGRIYDVVVDIRRSSPQFGRSMSIELDADAGDALWVPPGMAHGFQVITDDALVVYKVTDFWNAAAEQAIRWNDPALDIAWPIADPVLSGKDASAPSLEDVSSLPEI